MSASSVKEKISAAVRCDTCGHLSDAFIQLLPTLQFIYPQHFCTNGVIVPGQIIEMTKGTALVMWANTDKAQASLIK